MKKLFTYIGYIAIIVGAVASIITILDYQSREEKPQIEVQLISSDQLTNIPKENQLKALFWYKDSLITNLWKYRIAIKNIGTKTIIAKGSNKNTIDEYIKLSIDSNFNIIDAIIKKSDFPISIKRQYNNILFNTVQWRSGEQFEIVFFAEQKVNIQNKIIYNLDERQIIDATVSYTKITEVVAKPKPLIDYLPKTLKSVLRWVNLIMISLLFITLITLLIAQLYNNIKYRKWKNEWLSTFNDAVKNLDIEKSQKHPLHLPNRFWEKILIPKPDVSTFGKLELFSMCVFILIMCLPFLWLIHV